MFDQVKRSPVPLSSDAFSNFGKVEKQLNNREVTSIVETMKSQYIPTLAKFLDNTKEILSDPYTRYGHVMYVYL